MLGDVLTAVNQADTAFYICGTGQTLDILDLVNRVLTTVLHSQCGYGASMAITPDGNELYSADGYTLHVFNASTGQLLTQVGNYSALVSVAIGRVAFPPTVYIISPTQGSETGGTTVTITGTDFNTATDVDFGGTAASWFTVDSDTQITAVTRPQTNGTIDVTVTDAAGTSPATAADKFTFFPPIPSITAVSPSSGTMDGGTTVTITGAWFTNAFRVTFGNTAAASFHVDSSTQITAVTPYHDAGTVDVSVTTDVDTSPVVASGRYTFRHGS